MITEEINKLNTKLKTKKESINKMKNDKEKVDSEILVIEKLKKLIEDKKASQKFAIFLGIVDILCISCFFFNLSFAALIVPFGVSTIVEVKNIITKKNSIKNYNYNKSKKLNDLLIEEEKLNNKKNSINSIIETYNKQYSELGKIQKQIDTYNQCNYICDFLSAKKELSYDDIRMLDNLNENKFRIASDNPIVVFDTYEELDNYNSLSEENKGNLLKEKIYYKNIK